MSDNLKIHIFIIIIIEKFCQTLKVFFCYTICERQLGDNSGRFFYALQMPDRPTFGALSNQGLCHLCSVANTTENLSDFTNKKQVFGLCRKLLSYNFHL